MKYIPLTKGKFAIVDDDDYEALICFKWHCNAAGYSVRRITIGPGKRAMVLMHRLIAGTPPGKETDHINMDKLDNRKCNLRICTPAENKWNLGKRKDNMSGYKGVGWHKGTKKFMARIRHNNTRMYLGLFPTAKAAHNAYKLAAATYHGEFSHT